jgi:NADH dehydrogenase
LRGRVFVTGAGGFVGSAVVPALLDRGYQVAALSHRRSITAAPGQPLWTVVGDLFDDAALAKGLDRATAIVHLVGIIAERPKAGVTFDRIHDQGTARLVAAAKKAGVKRFIYVSALGARPDAPSAYHRTKFAAEQHVRAAGLDWTILQPSLIHGSGGQFTKMLAGWARGTAVPYLFMPYFGAGPLGRGHKFQVQPIHVDDVAHAVADSLENPATIGEVYPLGGPDRMTWPEMYRTAANAIVGHDRPIVPIPAWYAELLTRVVPRSLLPFGRSEVQMSQEENVCEMAKAAAAFGWTPRPFDGTLTSTPGTI